MERFSSTLKKLADISPPGFLLTIGYHHLKKARPKVTETVAPIVKALNTRLSSVLPLWIPKSDYHLRERARRV